MPFLLALLHLSVLAVWLSIEPAALPAEARAATEGPAQAEAEAAVEVVRVVDGDTLVVSLEGEPVSLRLLSVDTEEKIAGRPSVSASKPETVFGQETTLWAQELFAGLGKPARVGLVFPEGRRLDAFGRLLCHVILPDGRDYNRLLVEEGRSPYFNKYGNSRIAHESFVEAQAAAQEARRGIWDPSTNQAKTPEAPSAKRPYDRLLPWWEARARAIDEFRRRNLRAPDSVLSAEDSEALLRADGNSTKDPERRVTVFGEIERFFEEADGSLTVRMRSGGGDTSLRVEVPATRRRALEPELRASVGEFRQNFVYVTGGLARSRRGLVLRGAAPEDWEFAQPAHPPASGR